jgi:Rrf2 family protein
VSPVTQKKAGRPAKANGAYPRSRGIRRQCETTVRISAKADYAMRAVLELAAADSPPVKRDEIVQAQKIPVKFLESILGELRQAGIVSSQRGADGGYWLARPPEEITVADVMRVVEGPLASIRESRPEDLDYSGSAASLREVWIALRANMREVLEGVTLAEIAHAELPRGVEKITEQPEAWVSH